MDRWEGIAARRREFALRSRRAAGEFLGHARR